MDLINAIDLHLLEGVRGVMRLDIDSTYKLEINLGSSLREL